MLGSAIPNVICFDKNIQCLFKSYTVYSHHVIKGFHLLLI